MSGLTKSKAMNGVEKMKAVSWTLVTENFGLLAPIVGNVDTTIAS